MFKSSSNYICFEYQKRPEETRRAESSAVMAKYKDRVPVICEVVGKSVHSLELDKRKFLVPLDLTLGQFLIIIHKRLSVGSDQAIFIFTESGNLSVTSHMISEIYAANKNSDGFLYLAITAESTFGSS